MRFVLLRCLLVLLMLVDRRNKELSKACIQVSLQLTFECVIENRN